MGWYERERERQRETERDRERQRNRERERTARNESIAFVDGQLSVRSRKPAAVVSVCVGSEGAKTPEPAEVSKTCCDHMALHTYVSVLFSLAMFPGAGCFVSGPFPQA